MANAPRWDLDTIYTGFDDPSFDRDCHHLSRMCDRSVVIASQLTDDGESLKELVHALDIINDTYEHLLSFSYAHFSVNTRDAQALSGLQKVERLGLSVKEAVNAASRALASLGETLDGLCEHTENMDVYSFVLAELARRADHLMSEENEQLAADLQRSGADSWGRLQEAVSSTADALWDEKTGERRSVTQLRSLAFDADRSVRKKAFELELSVWKQHEIPLSYALNGVKGFSIAVDSRRGYESSLEYALQLSRITPKTLDALLTAIKQSRPIFHRYFSLKARALGLDKLAFYDLFAPVGATHKRYSYAEAKQFIIESFSSFDPRMGDFARHAFDHRWIDAPPAEGKVGGAYCTSFPLSRESRILCNFEGSFSDVSTIAHELGHAYHGDIIGELPGLLKNYPMTLAETASIFSETVIFHQALDDASPTERAGMIEGYLQDASQVIIDIYSRFLFEQNLFAERRTEDVSAQRLCSIMSDAQKSAYGTSLDEKQLHPYMWAVKGHYYSADLPFYNFPYAFGLLFALGLYAQYRKEPEGFPAVYRDILSRTGRYSAVDVAASAGCDIESTEFWEAGIVQISELIDEFEKYV
jgi:pepF/M3 family oligoendopeptidase